MATTSTGSPEPCPPPSKLQKQIQTLEEQSKKQDQSDAKMQLAELTKIGTEVEQAKAKYKQEYDSLIFAFQQSSEYQKLRSAQVNEKVPERETEVIKNLVECADKQIAYLKDVWVKVRDQIPSLTRAYLAAQNTLGDAEEPYRQALAYKGNQNDLDALQARSTKELDAKNFRGAYFLVEIDMKNGLKKKPLPPENFNEELEPKAITYYEALDNARKAKTELDQATGDLQKKKKAYDDAVAKRRDDILKQIADERFSATPAESPYDATAAQAGTPT